MKASCGGCEVTWAMETNRAHCSVCHMTFSSIKTFDMHRNCKRAYNICKSPESVGLALHGGTWYASVDEKSKDI
jgi:hypothetical protein